MIQYLLLLLIPLYVVILISLKSHYSKMFPHFFGVALVKKTKLDYVFLILNTLLLTLIILIIIDPKIPLKNLSTENNVILVLDTSGSMTANDIVPTRFDAALKYSEWLIKNLKSNDYVGVIGFSDSPYIVSFLTQDKNYVIMRLKNAIRMPDGGTNIGDAIIMATDLAAGLPRKSFIILLSDGVANVGTDVNTAIEYAKKHNMQIFTIAVGEKEKTFVGYDFFGRPQYVGVDVETLKKIAEETNGYFFRAIDNADLDQIYHNLKEEITSKPLPRSIRKELIIAFILLFIIYVAIKLMLNIPY